MAMYKKIKKGESYTLLSGEVLTNLSNFSIRLRIDKKSETQNATRDNYKEHTDEHKDVQESD